MREIAIEDAVPVARRKNGADFRGQEGESRTFHIEEGVAGFECLRRIGEIDIGLDMHPVLAVKQRGLDVVVEDHFTNGR